jgi:hypothetical protein
MTTLTIKVPSEAEAKLSAFVKELGGEVISAPSKKSKLLKEIKKGLKEVKKIREGKSPSYTMSDLFNEE